MADAIPVLNENNVEVTTLIRETRKKTAFQELMYSRSRQFVSVPNWVQYYKCLRDFEGSFLWTFGLKQSLLARIVKLIHDVPWKLVMPRNGLDYTWKKWMHWTDRFTQNQVDLFIPNSHTVSQHLFDAGIQKRRTSVVRSGLPQEWYENTSEEVAIRFVMVGNHRPEKNQLRGIQAFLESRVPTTLTVYTDDGTALNNYLGNFSEEDQRGVVIIEGHQIIPQDFDSYGFLLHPSISESLPLTVLEAQARKCFVLAADTGDTADLITNANGSLFDPFSIADMKAKIVTAFTEVSRKTTRPVSTIRTVSEYVEDILGVLNDASHEASNRE